MMAGKQYERLVAEGLIRPYIVNKHRIAFIKMLVKGYVSCCQPHINQGRIGVEAQLLDEFWYPGPESNRHALLGDFESVIYSVSTGKWGEF